MLDFSSLSDQQLFALAQGAIAECFKRGGDIAIAMSQELLSAEEKAQIRMEAAQKFQAEQEAEERERIRRETERQLKQEKIQREAETITRQWSIKAAFAAAIRAWGYDGEFCLNIWGSDQSDRRVYFKKSDSMKPLWCYTVYLVGNRRHPKGIEGEGKACWFDENDDKTWSKLHKLLVLVSTHWKSDIRIKSGDIKPDMEPSQKHLEEYMEIIREVTTRE